MATSSDPAKVPLAPEAASEKGKPEAQEVPDTAKAEETIVPPTSSPVADSDSILPQDPPTSTMENDSTPAKKEPAPETKETEVKEDGEIGPTDAPQLPAEPAPEPADDGWQALFSEEANGWYFYNRFTQQTTWENPRVSGADAASAAPVQPQLPAGRPAAGGYNPAIHGDYDPNAWYAQGAQAEDEDATAGVGAVDSGDLVYVSGGYFNRASGKFQTAAADGSGVGAERFGDEAKSNRQMGAFFDVDAAANAHDGRSLKAERSGKKPSKSELKAFKEKRRAKKEEKRRAWLRD